MKAKFVLTLITMMAMTQVSFAGKMQNTFGGEAQMVENIAGPQAFCEKASQVHRNAPTAYKPLADHSSGKSHDNKNLN